MTAFSIGLFIGLTIGGSTSFIMCAIFFKLVGE